MNCPYSFLRLGKCQKERCAKYASVIENYQDGNEIKQRPAGRCCDLQNTLLLLEHNQSLAQLLDVIKNKK